MSAVCMSAVWDRTFQWGSTVKEWGVKPINCTRTKKRTHWTAATKRTVFSFFSTFSFLDSSITKIQNVMT